MFVAVDVGKFYADNFIFHPISLWYGKSVEEKKGKIEKVATAHAITIVLNIWYCKFFAFDAWKISKQRNISFPAVKATGSEVVFLFLLTAI